MSDDIDEVEFTSDLEPYDPNKTYEIAEAHDEEDVPAALERETHDGQGGAVVPRANFVSFAADDETS